MSIRYRKRVQLFPGVTLNLSKSGISTTIGVKGASVNFNRTGTYLNTGIPGTGIYSRQKINARKKAPRQAKPGGQNNSQNLQTPHRPPKHLVPADGFTTANMLEFHQLLLTCHLSREDLIANISKAKKRVQLWKIIEWIAKGLLIGLFWDWFAEKRKGCLADLSDFESQLAAAHINVNLDLDSDATDSYHELVSAYSELSRVSKIWDVTAVDSATHINFENSKYPQLARKSVRFKFAQLPHIQSKWDAIHFENASGGDLYFYPAFLAVKDNLETFSIIDLRKIQITFETKKVIEPNHVPQGAMVVEKAWQHANKDGSRDRRFKNNRELPVCEYGQLTITSITGLQEAYLFSEVEPTRVFSLSFDKFQKKLN
jgi:hypothetical protein